jgi:hypothetical protein
MAAPRISQVAIRWILKQRENVTRLAEALKAKESEMLAALKAGTPVQSGKHAATIKSFERRSPSWKAVVERELGEEYTARVLAATKPNTIESLELN